MEACGARGGATCGMEMLLTEPQAGAQLPGFELTAHLGVHLNVCVDTIPTLTTYNTNKKALTV